MSPNKSLLRGSNADPGYATSEPFAHQSQPTANKKTLRNSYFPFLFLNDRWRGKVSSGSSSSLPKVTHSPSSLVHLASIIHTKPQG